MMKLRVGTILFATCVMVCIQANAEVTRRDLQVAARALGFMETPFTGQILMGIVYEPGNNRSRQQAEQIQGMLGSGMQSGNLVLVPELVPVSAIDSAQVDLFFLTEYLGTPELPLNSRKIPCITVDLDQVGKGVCVMGIRSAPKVEIIVNHRAAEISGTRFASVFRMMIREI